MNILQEYYNWVNNKDECSTWHEHYNRHIAKLWVRSSRQRNYQRNNDIIYKSTTTKRNDSEVKYELIPVEDGDFYIDEQFLKLQYQDKGYSSNLTIDKIRPFNFITMEVDDEMNLVADIPNIILDAEFKIDNNGNLTLKYG